MRRAGSGCITDLLQIPPGTALGDETDRWRDARRRCDSRDQLSRLLPAEDWQVSVDGWDGWWRRVMVETVDGGWQSEWVKGTEAVEQQ